MPISIRTFAPAIALSLVAAGLAVGPAAADESANIKVVQALYDAYGKGDINGLLSGLSDNVVWEVVGRTSDCSCMGKRVGRAQVAEFFKILDASYDVDQFDASKIYGSGDKVFVLGHIGETNKSTKKHFDSDFVHVFSLKGGLIVGFQEYSDTAKEADANRS